MSQIGVCVIGLGMGRGHANAYSARPDVDLYLCDLNRDRVRQAQGELDVKGTFASIGRALASEKVQALDTALPHHLHCPVARKAAAAGKHFMTEKPMARSLREADRMIEAADKAGIVLMVGENQRFMPTAVKAQELIRSGALGDVFLVQVTELWHAKPGGWRLVKKQMGGGNLIDSGIHAVDTLRLLGGEVVSVSSQNTRRVLLDLEGEDTNAALVGFAGGAMGMLATSWAVRHSAPNPHFAVFGTEGTCWAASGQLFLQSTKLPGYDKPAVYPTESLDTVAAECAHFVECIQSGRSPIMSGLEGRRDLEVVLAAYKSAQTGRTVKLPL